MRFHDRSDAGRRLAARLAEVLTDDEKARGDLVVLALPRGGVPVGYEVAVRLGAPLDVILVRKVGLPSQPELAMGAIGEDGVRVINDTVVRQARVSAASFAEVEARERNELERRAARFRGTRPRVPLAGRTALVVDDGIATGSTARAACKVARALGAARVIVAIPVAPARTVAQLREDTDDVDAVFVLDAPASFHAIGESYADFTQVADDQVVDLLRGSVTP
jgi:putative phosphoribosyl transferase